MSNDQTTKANDNTPVPEGTVTISLTDLAKGLGSDEDDLLLRLAEIFARRETESDDE